MGEVRSSRRVPRERAASPAEVRAAIEALTEADLLRLEGYAAWRIQGLGRKASGRTHEDLLNDAIHATLEGVRNWNKESVNFVVFLVGTMRSISSNWGNRFKAAEPVLESELLAGDAADGPGVLDYVADDAPTAEELMIARQHRDAIDSLFASDPLVHLILCELQEGARLKEIREKYELSAAEFEAALKRLRRRIAQYYSEKSHGR